jgi:hypothetical protein
MAGIADFRLLIAASSTTDFVADALEFSIAAFRECSR